MNLEPARIHENEPPLGQLYRGTYEQIVNSLANNQLNNINKQL